jgi:DNA-directed RNA polymerase beta subunit
MENWNLHCHGLSAMFQNVNYESADKFMVFFCTRCNNFAIGCMESDFYFCKMCEKSDEIVRLELPYITCLTFQELYAAGWGHTLIAKKKHTNDVDLTSDESKIFHEHQKLISK